jgi:hypothetical protein
MSRITYETAFGPSVPAWFEGLDAVLKTVRSQRPRGFESDPLRHSLSASLTPGNRSPYKCRIH